MRSNEDFSNSNDFYNSLFQFITATYDSLIMDCFNFSLPLYSYDTLIMPCFRPNGILWTFGHPQNVI